MQWRRCLWWGLAPASPSFSLSHSAPTVTLTTHPAPYCPPTQPTHARPPSSTVTSPVSTANNDLVPLQLQRHAASMPSFLSTTHSPTTTSTSDPLHCTCLSSIRFLQTLTHTHIDQVYMFHQYLLQLFRFHTRASLHVSLLLVSPLCVCQSLTPTTHKPDDQTGILSRAALHHFIITETVQPPEADCHCVAAVVVVVVVEQHTHNMLYSMFHKAVLTKLLCIYIFVYIFSQKLSTWAPQNCLAALQTKVQYDLRWIMDS